MKKFVLSLFVLLIGFISFGFCQFSQTYTISNNSDGNSQGNFIIPEFKAGVKFSIDSYIPGVRPGTSLSCNNLCTSSLVNGYMDYVNLATFGFGKVGTLGSNCSQCKLYIYPGGSMTYSIYYDKMPVATLSPVINNLNSVVIYILPYIAYLGLGIIVAVVGFIAIRWLIVWFKGKINFNFRSKRR